jgi:alpha-1,6-mannosyltransferase
MTTQQVPQTWKRWGIYLALMLPILLLGYTTERQETGRVILLYSLPFLAYVYIIKAWHATLLKEAIVVAILGRMLLLFSTPALSDDTYRFLWDGHLQKNDINPYALTPYEVVQEGYGDAGNLNKTLYNQLNSKEYYSVYPPAAQLLFYVCSKWSFGNDALFVFLLKFFLFLMEIMTISLLPKVLRLMGRDPNLSLLYFLNPLVIVELSGNIHLETAMIAWCLLAVYIYLIKNIHLAGIAAGLALSFKFTPLIAFPLLLRPLGWKKALILCCFAALPFLLGFVYYIDEEIILNIGKSIGLYFHTFEFNGSIFYLYRLSGEQMEIWRTVLRIAGPLLTIALIIFGSRRSTKNNLAIWALLSLSVYLFLSGNVHPWYIAPLVLLTPFTQMRFPIAWSAMIILTYSTYATNAYMENYWFILLEYTVVYAMLILDLVHWKQNHYKIQP